jgi:POT family proton-dependent oligopeptide transporter
MSSDKLEQEKAAEFVSYDETEFHEHEDQYGPEPTAEDYKTLREVADAIPYSAYLVIVIEFCERFTYYGLTGPFQNYIQNPAPPSCK